MSIKDEIMKKMLDAKRKNFDFNTVLLGGSEYKALLGERSALTPDEKESIRKDWDKYSIQIIKVNEPSHLSIANVLDTNEPAHTLNLKKES